MREAHHHIDKHDVLDVFSPEPEKRTIELALLRRMNLAAALAAANILDAAKMPGQGSFATDLAYVQSPVFATMARALGESVPDDADFRPFRSP